MALEFNPTNVRVFYAAPTGVDERQFGIDITTGTLYYNNSSTGTWTAIALNAPSAPAGSNGDIQMNTSGAFAASHLNDTGAIIVSTEPVNITGLLLASGELKTSKIAAPADNSLLANQVSVWFDPTNSASKLMIKGKSADGTVVTGSVTLS